MVWWARAHVYVCLKFSSPKDTHCKVFMEEMVAGAYFNTLQPKG